MKKLTALILCLILLCSCASAPVEESSKVEESESASSSEALSEEQKDKLKAMFAETWEDKEEVEYVIEVPENYGKEGGLTVGELEEGKSYVGYAELLFEAPSENEKYVWSEGSAYDGEYFYTVVIDVSDTEGIIVVSDESGNTVRRSEPLNLGHANSATYVAKENAIYVAHCQGGEESDFNTYHVVDIDTLEVTKTVVQDYPMTCFAYCEAKDMFYSAEWAGQYLDIWDGNFEHIAQYSVPLLTTVSQGCYATEEGFWYARSNPNEMALYDWDGNFVREIFIPNFPNEFEDIAYIDEDTVIVEAVSLYGYGAQYYEVTFYEQP